MSARKYVTVWCDGVTPEGTECGEWYMGSEHRTADARRMAKAVDHWYSTGPGRDFCTERCARSREESPLAAQ